MAVIDRNPYTRRTHTRCLSSRLHVIIITRDSVLAETSYPAARGGGGRRHRGYRSIVDSGEIATVNFFEKKKKKKFKRF